MEPEMIIVERVVKGFLAAIFVASTTKLNPTQWRWWVAVISLALVAQI